MPYDLRSSPRHPNSDHPPSISDQGSYTNDTSLTHRPLPLSIPDQGRPPLYRTTQYRPLTSKTKIPSLQDVNNNPPILQLPPQLHLDSSESTSESDSESMPILPATHATAVPTQVSNPNPLSATADTESYEIYTSESESEF